MELHESTNHYTLTFGDKALFCDRLSGQLRISYAADLCKEWNPVCLGQVEGVVGKLRYNTDSDWRLLLIRSSQLIGSLPDGAEVRKITKITILPLNTAAPVNLDIELCSKHHFGIKRTEKIVHSPDGKPLFRSMQEHLKSAAENVKPKKITWQNAPTQAVNREVREREKFERRIQEEILKLFQEGDAFYYCPQGGDLTNSVQRKHAPSYSRTQLIWRRADERFFWNRGLLSEIIDSAEKMLSQHGEVEDTVKCLEAFVLPVMQGFVQIEQMVLDPSPSRPPCKLEVALVSRRNKYRAGTRFRRRGVNFEGHVANYVETEQSLFVHAEPTAHTVSFVQTRGSVPVYWSQSGFKYRPPIKLEKGDKENQSAFSKHMDTELARSGRLVLVNLVDTAIDRPERRVADAYLKYLILYNSDHLTYVMFDFHDYCRGMRFENVSILLKGITEVFREMKYCWADQNGLICDQKSVFRVNCVDCLDRTNVVQCTFAVVVMETQLRKLGLLYPDESLPPGFHRTVQGMWANNGDAISRQYAGTVAMKGDYTRTGERTMNGLMRDGVSSMSRYYLRFREISRQAAIDLFLCNEASSELQLIRSGSENESAILKQKEHNIKVLTRNCRQLCLEPQENCLSECILIACSEDDPLDILTWNEKEIHDMNTVVLITEMYFHFVRTDHRESNKPVYLKIPLNVVDKIELGLEPAMFRSRHYTLRVHYRAPPTSSPSPEPQPAPDPTPVPGLEPPHPAAAAQQHSLTFRQPALRLFNNLLVPVRGPDEATESLRAVTSAFVAAVHSTGGTLPFDERTTKLEKLRPQPPPSAYVHPLSVEALYEDVSPTPRRLSSVSLLDPERRASRRVSTRVPLMSLILPASDLALEHEQQFSDDSEEEANGEEHEFLQDVQEDVEAEAEQQQQLNVNPATQPLNILKLKFTKMKDKVKMGLRSTGSATTNSSSTASTPASTTGSLMDGLRRKSSLGSALFPSSTASTPTTEVSSLPTASGGGIAGLWQRVTQRRGSSAEVKMEKGPIEPMQTSADAMLMPSNPVLSVDGTDQLSADQDIIDDAFEAQEEEEEDDDEEEDAVVGLSSSSSDLEDSDSCLSSSEHQRQGGARCHSDSEQQPPRIQSSSEDEVLQNVVEPAAATSETNCAPGTEPRIFRARLSTHGAIEDTTERDGGCHTIDLIIASCGILCSSRARKPGSNAGGVTMRRSNGKAETRRTTSAEFVVVEPRLCPGQAERQLAATGVFQRRVERISLQLSIDDSATPPATDISDSSFLHTSGSIPEQRELALVPTSPSSQPADQSAIRISWQCQRTMKMSFSESALATATNFAGSQQVDGEVAGGASVPLAHTIHLPPVSLANPRMVERLRKKQFDQTREIEELRMKLCPDKELRTTMIIF